MNSPTPKVHARRAARNESALDGDALLLELDALSHALDTSEGQLLAAVPATYELAVTGDHPIASRALERRRRALEAPVMHHLAALLAQPEHRHHAEMLAEEGRVVVMRDGRPSFVLVHPALEGKACRFARRLRTSWGLALRRHTAAAIADTLTALGQRLPARGGADLPIPFPDIAHLAPLPPTPDIALVRRVAHEADAVGAMIIVDLTLGARLDAGPHAPPALRTTVARESATIERTVRAFVRMRKYRAQHLAGGLTLQLAPNDPAAVVVRLPTLDAAVAAHAAFLRSAAGLQPGRERADAIAGVLETAAVISQTPARRRA